MTNKIKGWLIFIFSKFIVDIRLRNSLDSN